MATVRIILNESFAINYKYRVILYVVEVPVGRKFPEGVKAKFILINSNGNFPRLLVDNHRPFGFHMHTQLPSDEGVRIELPVKNHNEALDVFFQEVERILKDEND